ncbi:MAG TPA: hypothetical protein VHY84_06950 [Bryobacteraceae bacterium]|jgi:uncharacterized membrane protein|nr:hypothetical protein [Bryobacteraceae bacterium]
MKTVAALFPSLNEAGRAYEKLQHMGIPRESISLIAGNDDKRHDEYLKAARKAITSTGEAAASGASLGGGVGIVAMLIALSIPGVGPIVALGPLLTVLAGLGIGAAAGGMIGALHNMGISREEAPLYEEAVRRGAVIVAAVVDEQFEEEAVAALKELGSRDVRDEADTWTHAGWSGPVHDPHPYVSDSTKRTRSI